MAQVRLPATTRRLAEGSAKATLGLLLGRPSLVTTKCCMPTIGRGWPGYGPHQEPYNGLSVVLSTKTDVGRATTKSSLGCSDFVASRWALIWL